MSYKRYACGSFLCKIQNSYMITQPKNDSENRELSQRVFFKKQKITLR